MLGESTTDHRNRTFVLVLLTFCPPGPDGKTPEVLTPNLDRFLDEGLVFRNSYVQVAVCGPSRSSLLPGRRLGGVGGAPEKIHLARRLTTYIYIYIYSIIYI